MAEKKTAKAEKTVSKITDKQKALQTALEAIEKNYGKGAVMKLGEATTMNVEAISTGSVSLDIALGIGGVGQSGSDQSADGNHLTVDLVGQILHNYFPPCTYVF